MRRVSQACKLLFSLCTVLASPLAAQNRLFNPDLDLNDLGWTEITGSSDWILFDADACHVTTGSGGLNLGSAQNGAHQTFLAQSDCVVITPSEDLCWGMEYNNGGTTVYASLKFYLDEGCSNDAGAQSNASGPASPGSWTSLLGCTTAGGTHHGVRFWVSSTTPNTMSGFTMVADRMFLGTRIQAFTDDFEAHSFCRWSPVAP